jgi:hypothetical protein
MIELAFFGKLFGTLSSALSVVLVIVALTSATYLVLTLIAALRTRAGAKALPPGVEQRARRIGLGTVIAGACVALAGLRIGSAGSGGELIPTLSVIVAGAAALGSLTVCAVLGGARVALSLEQARASRAARIEATYRAQIRLLDEATQKHLTGADLRDEEASAGVALTRLRSSLEKLAQTRDEIEKKLAEATLAGPDSDLAAEYRRARGEVVMKLELGERIRDAAEAAAFRFACSGPLRWLVRRRPREAMLSLERLDGGNEREAPDCAKLEAVKGALTSFLGEVGEARRALEALVDGRPRSIEPGSDEDPWMLAFQDLNAVEEAHKAVLARVEVVRVRRAAQATIEEVADAAAAVSSSAKGMSVDQAALEELATEVTRAETAVVMATPVEGDPGAITRALSRCTAALGRSDGASLDELLKALRAMV